MVIGDFPGGPMVKNLPCNAGEVDSTPGQGNKIPHSVGQLTQVPQLLSSHASTRACMLQTTEPMCSGACTPQLEKRKPTRHNQGEVQVPQRRAHVLQQKILHASMKIPHAATKTQHSQKLKKKTQKTDGNMWEGKRSHPQLLFLINKFVWHFKVYKTLLHTLFPVFHMYL